MKVANKKIIRCLSFKSMKASEVRNRVAVLAIALTTVLFTALFTIAMSIVYGFQQSNFRQVGGYEHGGFKYLTKEQVDELRTDPLIKEYGVRYIVGDAAEKPFNKERVEISCIDENEAKFCFMDFVEGHLPAENTNEAATDERVLELLGIEPELGAEFEMTFNVGGRTVTKTFTLSGWWEYDPIIPARQMAIPMSRAEAIFDELEAQGFDLQAGNAYTKTYSLDVMFKSSSNIAGKLIEVLEHNGYQNEDRLADNYISIGVNWGYVSSILDKGFNVTTALAIVAALLLIIFTGYLIIYNVFQISVSNDIRSYGLLKTVGTTGKQIRSMVRIQSLLLSCIGIPIGIAIGYILGALLTPVVINQLNGVQLGSLSVSPWIFIGAAIFSLITVIISLRRPSKVAARVSPIEALRYTEGSGIKKKHRNAKKGTSIFGMALANLGRNKSKTIITITSLSLAVVLFQMTMIFTNGFDMDKYLRDVVVDFMISDASYFNVSLGFENPDNALPEDIIREVASNDGIIDGGRTYSNIGTMSFQLVTEETFRGSGWSTNWYSPERVDEIVNENKLDNGLIKTDMQLYGMDDFCLEKLEVFEGDISKLSTGGNYIAAVHYKIDGEMNENSNWSKLGDIVTVRFIDEYEYYNTETGEIYGTADGLDVNAPIDVRCTKYHDVDYEVAALVSIPTMLSYRYANVGAYGYIMGTDTFFKEFNDDCVMYYAFDTTEEARDSMEEFISNYTQNVETAYDYDSRKCYEEEFTSFRDTVRLMGGVLSFIVGLVGILNFLNAILTGIAARQHEFAVLQSVGMTGKQLNKMLVTEGLLYALGSVMISALLGVAAGPLIGSALGSMFWFFTYKFTIMPILVVTPFFIALGVAIPFITYHLTSKKSVVERLREAA